MKFILNIFGEKPALKLMFSVMIRAAVRWRALKVTDFERSQLCSNRLSISSSFQNLLPAPSS